MALYKKRADAYNAGGQQAGAAATAAGESERQSVANINALLRQIFGPEAQGIIDQILALYNERSEAYKSGGEGAAAGCDPGRGSRSRRRHRRRSSRVAGAIDEGTGKVESSLTARQQTLQGVLERSDISPTLRANAQNLQNEFVSGDNLTAEQIARGRDLVAEAIQTRQDRIVELVEGGASLSEAVRIADGELADTFVTIGQEIGLSAEQGGQLAAQGIGQGQDAQIAAIEALKSGLSDGVGGISGQVTPQIAETHRALMDAFIQGAQVSGGGIDQAEAAQIAAMQQYQQQLDNAVMNAGQAVAGSIDDSYVLTANAQQQGSSRSVEVIQAAYVQEQAKFQTQSSQLIAAIQNAKGDEKAKLIAEYEAVQREHAAKSDAFTKEINDSATAEAGAYKDSFDKSAAALKSGALVAVQGTRTAYGDITDATNTASGTLSGLLGTTTGTLAERQRLLFDTQKEVMIARREVLRSITRQSYELLKQENSHGSITVLVPSLTASGSRIADAVVTLHEKVRKAISDQLVKTRAALREQYTVLQAAASGSGGGGSGGGGGGRSGASGDALDHTVSTYSGFPVQVVSAHAADPSVSESGFAHVGTVSSYGPAYAVLGAATAEPVTRAFAAGENLFDSFATTARNLTANTAALSVGVNVTGNLGRMLALPIGILDRAANLMWETARFERETALINRETAQLLGKKTGASTAELARRPRKRGP